MFIWNKDMTCKINLDRIDEIRIIETYKDTGTFYRVVSVLNNQFTIMTMKNSLDEARIFIDNLTCEKVFPL